MANLSMGRKLNWGLLTSITVSVSLFSGLLQAGEVIRFHNQEVKPIQTAAFRNILSQEMDDFVVQFKSPITNRDHQELKKAGVQVFRYVPDDALIVRASQAQLSGLSSKLSLNGILPYKGAMKVASELPPLSVFSRTRAVDVAIFTFSEQDKEKTLALLKSLDPQAFIIDSTGKVISARLRHSVVNELSQASGIEFIQELIKMEPMHITLDENQPEPDLNAMKGDYTDLTGYETGTKIMNMESVWGQGFFGTGQVVGMADTGLDTGNLNTLSADFAPAFQKGIAFGIGAKGDWGDPMGHGTHVAGSVLSRGTASQGLLKGAAYGAKIVAQGMWSPIISNLSVPPKLVNLFQTAYDEGARVHTNSWGSANANTFGSYEGMAQQADQFMWDNQDMLIIFAAGNAGVDKDKDGRIDPVSVGPPGTAKNILTVGASENLEAQGGIQKPIKELRDADKVWGAEPIFSSKVSDNPNGMAMFSSRGPTKDKRLKPEISAPGTNILSNRSHNPQAELLWSEYNKDYVWSGGTSMATPLTAGAAAVTREMLIAKFGVAKPSAALVKATLMHTAFDMFPGQYGENVKGQEFMTRRPNSDEGYGRVDMERMAQLDATTRFVDASVEQGKELRFPVKVSQGKVLANLVYTDAPGTPSAAAALVNDLDMSLVAVSGSLVSAPLDRINNAEIIELSNIPAGDYELVVKGFKVPMGKNGLQPFALVYTAQ
jgi:serine protease AprX